MVAVVETKFLKGGAEGWANVLEDVQWHSTSVPVAMLRATCTYKPCQCDPGPERGRAWGLHGGILCG